MEQMEQWNKITKNGSRSTTYGCSKTRITLEQLEQTGVSGRDSGFVGRYLRFVGRDLRSFLRFFRVFFTIFRLFFTVFCSFSVFFNRISFEIANAEAYSVAVDDSGTPTE